MTLAFDPAVPHRDALLDGRALGAGTAARVYAKYRVGESLRVVHRLRGGGHVAARSYPAGASEDAYHRALAELDRRRNGSNPTPADPDPTPTDPGRSVNGAAHEPARPPVVHLPDVGANGAAHAPARPPVVHLPEVEAVVWTFPHDRKLAALPLLAGGSGALDRLVGRDGVTPRLVAYCAERSATAQCLDPSGRVLAYVKVHAGDGADRERRRLERVAAEIGAGDPHLRVPRVLAAADGALALEAVEGRRLDTLGEALGPGLERLGAALATLHERSTVPARRFERLDGERLQNAVRVIGRARPDAAAAASNLLDWLLDRHGDADGPAVSLHGDPGLRNAILDGGRVALIDLEDAAAGPAAADLGRVLAGLPRAAAEPLLSGYTSVRRPPGAAALRWHTAASVLARWALPAVSRVRPDALHRLRAVLEEARG